MSILIKRAPEVAKIIQHLRVIKGLTQQELADKSSLSRSCIQKLEGGVSYPQRNSAERIANVLDTSLQDVMGGDYKPEADHISVGSNWSVTVGKLPTPMALVSPSGTIQAYNKAFLTMTGYPKSQVTYLNVLPWFRVMEVPYRGDILCRIKCRGKRIVETQVAFSRLRTGGMPAGCQFISCVFFAVIIIKDVPYLSNSINPALFFN